MLHRSRPWEWVCLLGGFVLTLAANTVLIGFSLPNTTPHTLLDSVAGSWFLLAGTGLVAAAGLAGLAVGVCRLTSPAAASRAAIQHSGVFLPWTRGAAVFAWLVTTGLLLSGLDELIYGSHGPGPALTLLAIGFAFFVVSMFIMIRDLRRPWYPSTPVRAAPLDRQGTTGAANRGRRNSRGISGWWVILTGIVCLGLLTAVIVFRLPVGAQLALFLFVIGVAAIIYGLVLVIRGERITTTPTPKK